MSKDLKDLAPGDIIRVAEEAMGVTTSPAEFVGSTGYASVKMVQAELKGADMVIRVRSPKHRAYIGMSSGLMAANPELVKIISNGRDGSPFSSDFIQLQGRVIRFFDVMPKEIAKVLPLLRSIKPSEGEPANADPFAALRVEEISGLAGRDLQWTTYPDLGVVSSPCRVTAVKLGDCMPSVLLLEDGRVMVSTHTDCPPVSLHVWVMGWTDKARSFQEGPMRFEQSMVNHILGGAERSSYRIVDGAEEWAMVKGMIRTANREASNLFDQMAVKKGINPSIMN